MTHNEDKNQLIETDPEITVITIIFYMFKRVKERHRGDVKKTHIKFLYMKTIMSEIKKYTPNGINGRHCRRREW